MVVNRKMIVFIAFLVMPFCLNGQKVMSDDVLGYWIMSNGKTPDPDGIIHLYRYNDKIYGMVMTAVNPEPPYEVSNIGNKKLQTPYLHGSPYVEGLNILWDLQWNASKKRYTGGKITDPARKGIFKAEIWRDGDKLIVRGGLGSFWEKYEWLRASVADLPAGCPVFTEPIDGPTIPVKN